MNNLTGEYLQDLYYQCKRELPYKSGAKYFRDREIYQLMAEKINKVMENS